MKTTLSLAALAVAALSARRTDEHASRHAEA